MKAENDGPILNALPESSCSAGLDASMNTPFDAANRRAKRLAHIEHTKMMSAFHDGANTPEIKAAIDRAREKILKRIKAKQASNK